MVEFYYYSHTKSNINPHSVEWEIPHRCKDDGRKTMRDFMLLAYYGKAIS